MVGRRGQGAMEYLMTYGWAILVVMVVGIVMWQLGIFNLGGTAQTASGFAKIKPQLAATGVRSGSGIFMGVFTNGVGTTIGLNSGRVNTSTIAGCDLMFTPSQVAAGDNFVANNSNNAVPCVPIAGLSPGDPYTAMVYMNYNVTIGSNTVVHTESGTIRGPLE